MTIPAYEERPYSFESMVNEILPGARIIKLKGFSRGNTDYDKAKWPVGKWRDSKPMEDLEISRWMQQKGWIGAVIPDNRIIVDIDDSSHGELVKDLLEAENVHHHCIKTPNGWQFVFKSEQAATKEIKQITKFFTQIGVVIDTRTSGAGYIVFPTETTEGRYIASKSLNKLNELPHFLKPLRSQESAKNKETNELYEFPIPIQTTGSRNHTLYKFASHLRSWGVDPEELSKSMELVYEYFLLEKDDFPLNELRNLTNSAIQWKPEPAKGQSFQLHLTEEPTEQNIIPYPFHIENNALFKIKRIEGEETSIMVSRLAPMIKKEFSNIERNSVHYEIAWKDRGQEKREVVQASTISTKRELLALADYGFSVNDLNYKDLIKYFDQYLAQNSLDQSYMVERLGHIKDSFIHPLKSQGVEIIPNDSGERQLLEAFQTSGTVDGWKTEVFERVKQHPKALFLVLSSFASVLLKDIKVSPFIVDLSGSTSQGKTTALQVARSVWGTEGLLNEWNATRVAIERKAGFLNSFPLYMDDTRKADERILQSVVYQFSGGRSKGRGSLKGSQSEATWNNVLISSGEVSLADYAAKAGGAAARVISLIDQPFEGLNDFSDLYKAIESHYGAIGLEFLNKWHEVKKEIAPEFHQFKEHYTKKAKGNEVLTRLAMYYAAVHFAGSVARKFLKLDMDLKLLDSLFDEMAEENKATDKPKQLLEEILLKLDSSRREIYYDQDILPAEIKAIYKFDTLCLMPAFLKDTLGAEEKLIRREWMKRGFTETFQARGKPADYKPVFHNGKTFRVVVINKEFIDETGLDFKES